MNQVTVPSDIAEIVQHLGDVALDFSGKTILLTGGNGFLGRYFIEVFAFLNKNVLVEPCRVISFDNNITSGKFGEQLQEYPGIKFVRHNVVDPIEWNEGADYIIHGAGIASPYYYRAYPLETLQVATIGTQNMLELAKRLRSRFTFFSSSEIYGDPDLKHIPIPESYRGNVSVAGPRSCYDESKRLGETLCYIFHGAHGIATNTIRPFNVFGPGMQETDYRVLPNFASRIKGNKPLHIYGSGRQTRTFTYITDALEGFLRTITRGVPGEAYNIGNPNPEVSMLDLVKTLEKVIGRNLDYFIKEYPDSYPADEPQRRCPDIQKARLQLKFNPKVGFEEGIRRFITWSDKVYTGRE